MVALAFILATQSWLVFSDLRFDPFTRTHLVDRLAAAPVNRWRAIFASEPATGPSGSGADTNDALLELTLEGAHNAVSDPRVVIVDGDFLAHDFREKFDRTAKVHDATAYRAFVDKTVAFLAWELQAAFPRAYLLPVIGNGDGYCGDDASTPHGAFLAHMAADWAASVGPGDPNAFIAQFSTGGYYTARLPVVGAQAIVLNDVFWSGSYENACGDPKADPGGEELSWLQSTLGSISPSTPLWVIAHIPPGIDVFSSLRSGHAVPFLAARFGDALVADLSDHAGIAMVVAGHTHMSSFRVIGPDPSTPRAPMLVVPAVSPIFGNAPSFTVLDVDEQNAQVADAAVFILTRGRGGWSWGREYDFDSIYGSGTIDAAHLWNVEQEIFESDRVRKRFEEFYQSDDASASQEEATWRAHWCANVALSVTAYTACAMPQVQRDTQSHPSPPPPLPTVVSTPTP